MAGVGHEIGAHPFHAPPGGDVVQREREPGPAFAFAVQGLDQGAEFAVMAGGGEFDLASDAAGQNLVGGVGQGGNTQRRGEVTSLQGVAQKRPRLAVGEHDPAMPVQQQQRGGQAVQQAFMESEQIVQPFGAGPPGSAQPRQGQEQIVGQGGLQARRRPVIVALHVAHELFQQTDIGQMRADQKDHRQQDRAAGQQRRQDGDLAQHGQKGENGARGGGQQRRGESEAAELGHGPGRFPWWRSDQDRAEWPRRQRVIRG